MKKTVLTFGLIQGAVLSAMLLLTIPFWDTLGFDRSEIVGYTSMVLASLLIFFGVRSYRDNVAGGSVSFWRGLTVGVLIGAVAAVCYVVTWQVIQERVAPDYMSKYTAHIIAEARANGETETAIAERKAQLDEYAEMYKNPVIRAAWTFIEPLPVSLLMALVAAGVLSRRRAGARGKDQVLSGTRVLT